MADKFKYRLGKVLDLREKKEEKAKQDKAASQRDRDRERDALDELKTRLTGAKKSMGSALSAGQTANVQMGNDYSAALEKKIVDQEKKVKVADERVVQLEKEQVLATRDVKILEKHKDKVKSIWKDKEDRKEAISLDEMAINGYLKKRIRNQEEIEEEEDRLVRNAEQAVPEHDSPWISGLMETANQEAARRAKRKN